MHQYASIRRRRSSVTATLAVALGACLCAGQLVAVRGAVAAPAVPAVRAPAVRAPAVRTALPAVVPRLRLTANARTVAWGNKVRLLVRVTDPRTGKPVRGGTVTLQVRKGSRWVKSKTARVPARGEVRYTRRVTATTTYRFVFNGLNPRYKRGPSHTLRVAVLNRGNLVVTEARRHTGKPYRFGAAGPKAFDCSGLTRYVFRRVAGKKLPHSANAQRRHGRAVPRSQARPGDLLVFVNGSRGYHVGIYAGGRYMYDAPGSGKKVGKHKIWTNRYVVRRIIG